ncbi:MAG TPA: ATP-binding cassette domain-containing protein [Tepidisphaeraceae bacterium]|nr:ATP-binding cassette domain-containing protein [Tepidisphaeraceae bacterium]
MSNAVELDHVSKIFGTYRAVDDLSLVVPVGSIYGFIGPNGSGKTTTLRMITRIYAPDTGTVRVLGEAHHSANDNRVGYLPEESGVYNTMKVGELLMFYARLKGRHPKHEELEDWLKRIELPGVLGRRVQTLSKGQQQKIKFLAIAIGKPQLLLLDEPFSGLDPVNAVVIRELIQSLRANGTTIIFSTHDMRVAEELCDFIFMIYKGGKVLDGTLATIKALYGQDVIRVRMPGAPDGAFDRLSGVAQVTDLGNVKELRLQANADSQRVLSELIARGPIEQFERTSPSLQDIFVRIAAPDRSAMETMG